MILGLPLLRRHAADDGLQSVELSIGRRPRWRPSSDRRRATFEQVADRAHLADGQHLLQEVLEVSSPEPILAAASSAF